MIIWFWWDGEDVSPTGTLVIGEIQTRPIGGVVLGINTGGTINTRPIAGTVR